MVVVVVLVCVIVIGAHSIRIVNDTRLVSNEIDGFTKFLVKIKVMKMLCFQLSHSLPTIPSTVSDLANGRSATYYRRFG